MTKWLGRFGVRLKHRVYLLGSLRAVHSFSHSETHYSVKMGGRSIYKENFSLVMPIQKIVVHPDFRKTRTVRNDIALLLLFQPVNFTSAIQTICVPSEIFWVEAGTNCWVTGWGKTAQHGEARRQQANLGAGSALKSQSRVGMGGRRQNPERILFLLLRFASYVVWFGILVSLLCQLGMLLSV